MNEWIDISTALPEQFGIDGVEASELVSVLLDNGDVAEDWLINGKWVLYCSNNPKMPHVVAWRKK